MQFRTIDGPADTATVFLVGKLDIAGTAVIEIPMAVIAGTKKGLVVDLSAVTFLASIGIRHLVSTAKALTRRGGRVVLLRPSEAVAEVLTTSGVAELMPIVQSEADARRAV